jgi:hypothetical protein
MRHKPYHIHEYVQIKGFRRTSGYLIMFLLMIFFLFSMSSCSKDGSSHAKTGSGSVAFSIQWPGGQAASSGTAAISQGKAVTLPLSCATYGISTITAEVYDPYNILIAQGGPWACNAGSGLISSVSAGANRSIVLLLMDSSGTVIFRGEKSGITVL